VHRLLDRLAGSRVESNFSIGGKLALAEMRLVPFAEETATAGAKKADNDAVAGSDAAPARADLLDGPSGLVPVHRRERSSPGAVGEVDVAVTDRTRGDRDPYFTGPRWSELQILDLQGLSEGAADGGSHHLH